MIRKGTIIASLLVALGIGVLWVLSHTGTYEVLGCFWETATGWSFRAGEWLSASGERGSISVIFYVSLGTLIDFKLGSFAIWTDHGEIWLMFPIWFALVLSLVYPTMAMAGLSIQRQRRRRMGLCIVCGYDLRGTESGVCPECGMEINNAAEKENEPYRIR